MKNVLFMLFVAVMAIGCKGNEEPKDNGNTEKLQDSTSRVVNTSIQESCNVNDYIVVIDKSKFSSTAAFDTWLKNNPYNCTKQLTNPKCTNYAVIDLHKIHSSDEQKVANWLQANNAYICFDDSYQFIEKAHKVNAAIQTSIDTKINANDKLDIRLDNLINNITNFPTTEYNAYLIFNRDNNNKITQTIGTYASGNKGFSVPFINSIISVNNISSADYSKYTFTFVLINNDTKVGLKITNTINHNVLYYDISTEPKKPGTVLDHPYYKNIMFY